MPKKLFVGFCRSLRGVNPNLVWGKFGVFWTSELGGFWMTEKLQGFHETSPIKQMLAVAQHKHMCISGR